MVITISSSEAFPARSPMPLMVPSPCRTPCRIPSREFETARPRSLWQWALTITVSMLGTRFMRVQIRSPYSHGMAYPTVSGMLMVVAPAHLQLVLHVDVRGGDEGMDPGPLRVLQGLPGPVDVLVPGAAQAGNRDPLPNILGDDLDGFEVIRGGDREPCLDDIDAQSGQLAGQLQLLPRIHAVPGRLLSVA